MRLLLAIFLPFLSFFMIGRPIAGLFCLMLQITLIGWLPAAIWAVFALSQWKTDKKIKRALSALQASPSIAAHPADSAPFLTTSVGRNKRDES